MNIRKRITAFIIAFLIAVNPLQQSLAVSADDIRADADLPVEEVHQEDIKAVEDTVITDIGNDNSPVSGLPDGIVMPVSSEPVIAADPECPAGDESIEENEDNDPAEESGVTETEEITGDLPADDEAAQENKEVNDSGIITASTSGEYFDLMAGFPDCERIIVDTREDLSFLKVYYGIYFDGTYILGFERSEDLYAAVTILSEKGLEYAVDGTVSVCGDTGGNVTHGRINPDAKVRVAVIDTGSELYNEAYSVIGDDVTDRNGHGSVMCGAVLDETDNAYIISIKAIGDDGRGNMSDVYVAVQLAEDLGVDYILMAVSVRNLGKYDAFISLIENTKATVVASAGNNGTDAAKYLPAGISGVITVGALEKNGTLRSTSNYGDSVEYYVMAESTSEAASVALGIIVDGRSDELASEYKDASDINEDNNDVTEDDHEGSTGVQQDDRYHLIIRAEDDDVLFGTDNVHDSGITVYQRQIYHQSDYFSHPYNDGFGVYSDSNGGSSFSWDSHILYCIEDTKDIPDDLEYGGRQYYGSGTSDSDMKLIQAACAFGPTGELYDYAARWWKEHDTDNEILSSVKNDSAKMKIAMYAVTHFVVCKAYDGVWPQSTPGDSDSVPKVFVDYYNYLKSVRNGSTAIPGYSLSGWWCEIYRCDSFSDAGDNAAYQFMARGNATKTAQTQETDVNLSVGKTSSSAVDSGYFGLAGATYTLYGSFGPETPMQGDYELRNAIASFVMKEDGTTAVTYRTTVSRAVTYYLKETAAPLGYALDDTIYWITVSEDGSVTAGIMESYVSGGYTEWRKASGTGRVSVSGGSVDIIKVKDQPDKALFGLDKKLGANYARIRGRSYSFELWDNTDNKLVASGTATVSSNADSNTLTPVVWTEIADGYSSATGNRLAIIPGHAYQIMETTMSVNGLDLETPSGWTKGNAHGKSCFYQTFTAASGRVHQFTVTNNSIPKDDTPRPAYFSLNKQLGNNYAMLAGRTFDFELWDSTAGAYGVMVASGKAVIPSSATSAGQTSVVWSGINTAGGYKAGSGNSLELIAGHTYQIMETTISVNGRTLDTPSGWTKGTAHGKNCFYRTFNAAAEGQTYSFSLTNSVTVTLSLTKASADPSVTGGNSAYSLAGAKYVLAKGTAFSSTDTVGTFTIKADGSSDRAINVTCGTTYYLKETAAAAGYELDTTVYKIIIGNDGKASVSAHSGNGKASVTQGEPILINVKDTPVKTAVSLTKSSAYPAITNGNACYSLAGTSYGLYAARSDAAAGTNALVVFTVDANGNTNTKFSATYGKTYYLKEITAGKGYKLSDTVYAVTVAANGTVSVDNGVSVTASDGVSKINIKDEPGIAPLDIQLRKTDKNGKVVHNADLNGAVFRISYYARDLGASGNANAEATVIYNVTVKGNSAVIKLSDLKALSPAGGSNPDYIKNLPSGISGYPYGTLRIQEITAPAGYRLNDQTVRYRLGSSVSFYIENNSSYGNRNYWKQLADGTLELTELPETGYYELSKTLEDTSLRSSLSGFEYQLWNTSSSTSPVEIAKGVSQSDGRVLWTYTVPDYYQNSDPSKLLTGTTTYRLELPATEKNAGGAEFAIQYQVRELMSSMEISYGNTGIPYTYAAPVTAGKAWNKASSYYYKAVTVSDESVTGEKITNAYYYTGISVNKVVPVDNPFDVARVTFRVINTDGGKDTVVANGSVDSKGNVTWHRTITSGYGSAPASSVNVLDRLPLGHYRVEETWNKEYIDANGIAILIGEKNNNGWTKTETDKAYTYSCNIDLSDVSVNGKIMALSVENEREVSEFNLVKNVAVDGDRSDVTAQLYLIGGSTETLVATGTAKTSGKGTYGFEWDYGGEHKERDGLDTLVLPAGKYRIVENCPETYYKDTNIPYTYMTPEGFTSRVSGGRLQFYRDFELKSGENASVDMSITNVRIEGSFELIKVECSGDDSPKSFVFEVYYRGSGKTASDSPVLFDTVSITTESGKGTAKLSKLPEGWYEIRETGADSAWTTHWVNDATVTDGNKLVRLDSLDRSDPAPVVNDGVKENGNDINAVLVYNYAAPAISTALTDSVTMDHISSCSEKAELVDTVSYRNLMPGHYVVSGVLMDKNTGKEILGSDGNRITGSASFDIKDLTDAYGGHVPQSGTVKVTYTIDTSAIRNVTVVAFEELRKTSSSGELIASHSDINDAAQTVYIPDIGTALKDPDTDSHTATFSETAKLVDTVAYSNLIPGRTYTVTGRLVDKATGRDLGITASRTFTPTSFSGTVDVEFTVDTTLLKGMTVVAFETLKYKENDIAVHADINDLNQTVSIPDIKTTNISGSTKDKVVAYGEEETLTDTITYTNLTPGRTYTVTGTLIDKETGESLGITGNASFTAESSKGTVDVEFRFDSTIFAGKTIVAFETLKYRDKVIAVHADINDVDQTVNVPEIGTILTDQDTEDHVAAGSRTARLTDTVTYSNLVAGKEYTLTGTLMDKKTGREFTDPDGRIFTVSKSFTAEAENGTVEIEFVVDTLLIRNVTVVAFEKLYHNNVLIAVHTDIGDAEQTVCIPEIRTTLKDTVTDDHVAAEETVTLVDTVKYTNLLPGKEYTVNGVLVNKDTGEKIKDANGNAITASLTFKPERPEGSVDIIFEFSSKILKGNAVVAFENLKYGDISVASHTDINDEDQTVYFPEIHTMLIDNNTGRHVAAQGEKIRLTDTVAYSDLKPGLTYVMNGTLYAAGTGEVMTDSDGNPVTARAEFIPDKREGFVALVFEFEQSLLMGESLVAFEELTYKEKVVASHNDINDRDQTVDVPDIHTSFFDAAFGPDEDLARCAEQVELTDRVFYKNLTPGLEYRLYLTVMVRDTGEPLLDKDGNAVTAERTFVPETLDGYVDVSVTVDATLSEGRSLVAFESLDHENITLVIHADIEDRDQTLNIPKIRTTAADIENNTHTLTYKEKVTITDTVAYENLVVGKTYKITGTLYDKKTGEEYTDYEGNVYTAEKEFVAESSSGTETVVFTDVIVPFSKTEIVAFEDLTEKETGILIATHSDLTDENQTVRRPEVSTTATILNSKEIWLESAAVSDITVSDRILYEGFEPGRVYRIEATLYKTDGTQIMSAGQPLINIVEFSPAETDGEITLNTVFSSKGLLEGDKIVVFERFYDVATSEEISSKVRTQDILVSRHENLANEDQTVTVHYRPSTGGVVPAYSAAGSVLTAIAFAAAFVWFVISRKNDRDGI